MTDTVMRMFAVYVEDKPGVLNRVASLFRRRGFNIDSLTVGHTHQEGVSRMTICLEADHLTATRIEANLYKLVNVIRVEDVTPHPSVARDLALVKVATSPDTRSELLQIVEIYRAQVVDFNPESIIVEITGDEGKLDSFIGAVRPYGIIELVRTGVVAMSRGPNAPPVSPEFVSARVPEEQQV
ncbi:MAG: acetolactate synthase small subunit [Spirochaetia bacterium]